MIDARDARLGRQGLRVIYGCGCLFLLALLWGMNATASAKPEASTASQGLLLNPSFETADESGQPAHWTPWAQPGAITLSQHAFVGQRALRVEPVAGKTYRISQQVKLEHAGKYGLKYHVHITGQAQVHATWTAYDEQGEQIKLPRYWTRTMSVAQAASGWTPVTAELEIPAQARRLQLTFWFTTKGDPAGEIFLDDVNLHSREARQEAGAQTPGDAVLVYEQSFGQGASLDDWQVISGDWSIQDQALHGRGRGIIVYNKEMASPNMRLEYTAYTHRQPADLSALLAIDQPAPWGKLQGYFFGFGSRYNKTNTIQRLAGGSTVLAQQGGDLQTLEHGITPGKPQRVVVQRIHNELQMFVDGQLVLEGNDVLYASFRGERLGFYVWEDGFIDDIKVYALPWSATAALPQVEVRHQSLDAFEAVEQIPPASFIVDAGKPELTVVNMPTWVYKQPAGNAVVDDHCLRIQTAAADGVARVTRAFEPMASGIVEFDFLAREHGEIRFAVLDADRQELLHLVVTDAGKFAVDRPQGRRLLREKVRYQRRVFDADFRLIPQMWYTVRIQFLDGLAQIVLLDQYSEIQGDFGQGNMGDYMPLSSDPAFKMNGRRGAHVAIELKGRNDVCLDNLIAFGPVGTQSVRGKPLTQSAVSLLSLDVPPRKDPFLLKIQSYRHLTRSNLRITPRLRMGTEAPGYEAFHQAGQRYNQRLIDLAFLQERCEQLRRSVFHARNHVIHAALQSQLEQIQTAYQQAEQLQERALNAYADAYLDGQRVDALGAYESLIEQVAAAQARLNQAVDRTLAQLPNTLIATREDDFGASEGSGDSGDSGAIVWSSARRRWERQGQPVVYDYFSQMPGTPFYWDDLRLLGFERYRDAGAAYQAFPFRRTDDITLRQGQYVDPAGSNWQWLKRLAEDGRKGMLRLAMGMNYAVTAAPPWWVEEHEDQDIFMVDPRGRQPSDPVWREQYMLNWWHPAVRDLIDEQFAAVGRLANNFRDAITIVHAGWELKNTFPGGVVPGRNPSAVRAFQAHLQSEHGTISRLNEAWATAYGSFDEIQPPGPDAPPSGLLHAFNQFVHAGFTDWLARIGRAVRSQMPGVPIASDTQYTLGGRVGVEAIDPVGYFEAVDIKLYHSYQGWDRQLVDRWHGQLASAVGRAWGTMEWLISQGSPYMFQTDLLRNNALRERAMQMIWGATLMEFYGFGFGNWQYEIGIHEPRLDRMVFNYTAPLYPISMARARRIGAAALHVPLAKPRIGLLETTSSYYNRLPVREGIKQVAIALTEAGRDYEFLYEQLLGDGRQTLKGMQVLIVPYGQCMPDDLYTRIAQWVRQGGTLVTLGGPIGSMNQHGQPMTQRPPLRDSHGQGAVHPLEEVSPRVMQIVARHSQPRVACDNPDLQFCLRERDGTLYLYVLNWADAHAVEAEISVQGDYAHVVDEGLEKPMRLPIATQDDRITFRMTLGPAQVTLLRLSK